MTLDGVPVADGLFTWPADEPALIGSRCLPCGVTTFPAQAACPRCTSTEVTRHLLPRQGTLWTYTIQGFRPKSPPYEGPEEFAPYAVGYVELPGEVKVEALLVDVDHGALRIGLPMELAIVPFRSGVDGSARVTYSFRPVSDEPSSR